MGNIESGELTNTVASWSLSIPVSSKKSHILIIPKSLSETLGSYASAKASYAIYADEDGGIIEASLIGTQNTDTRLCTGASYWYDEEQSTYGAVFTETSIDLTFGYTSFGAGEFKWFAW